MKQGNPGNKDTRVRKETRELQGRSDPRDQWALRGFVEPWE